MSARPPRITQGDRLSLTVFLSLAVHALFVLGLGFTWAATEATRPPPMLDITLADRPQDEAPEDHDFLAQANQDGGGESEERERPDQQTTAITPGVPEGRQAMQSAPAPSAAAHPDDRRQVSGADASVASADSPSPEPPPEPTHAEPIDADTAVASAADPAERSQSISARYPSKQRINVRTRSHAAAEYMREWVNRVEQVGNLNYPDEARQRGLAGRVIMEVTLTPDGAVQRVQVLRASDHPALDQAAERIVELAAPFARIPPAVLEDNDLLVITRTWEFDHGARLQTR